MTAPTIKLDSPCWRPGTALQGEVDLGDAPPHARSFTLSLEYFTEGKGNRDEALVDRLELAAPPDRQRVAFRFHLPEGPYSFVSSLICLRWQITLELRGRSPVVRQPFLLTPSGEELQVERMTSEPEAKATPRSHGRV